MSRNTVCSRLYIRELFERCINGEPLPRLTFYITPIHKKNLAFEYCFSSCNYKKKKIEINKQDLEQDGM